MHIYYRKKIIVEKFTKESENNPVSYYLSFFVCIHLCFYVHIKKKPNVAQICGLLRWHSSENLPVSAGDAGVWARPLSWEDSLEKEMQPTPVSLPGESHGQRSLECCSP